MSLLQRIRELLGGGPKTAEELQAQTEARAIRDEMETIRLSQRSQTGENYQSGRGSRH